MKRKLPFCIAALIMIIAACNNPFFPERIIREVTSEVPVISVEDSALSDVECNEGEEVVLTVSVEGDEDDFSFQWYGNSENDNEGGTPIPGANGPSFRPPTDENGTTYYYVVITNKRNGKTTKSNQVKVTVNSANAYTIVIDISGNVSGDTVTVSPVTGDEGDTVTFTYTVANTALHNLLDFGGVTSPIASVNNAGNGTRTYTVNTVDASGGVITVTAIFTHTNLELDPISFTDTAGHITKTYGDAAFTNAIAAGYSGNGAITYHSSNTTVAAVNGSGQVTILRAGSAVITAEKAADTVYARAQTEYTLAVNPKPVTITGLSAANKQYDGTTVAMVTGVAVINGLIGGDVVTVSAGTAAFTDTLVGNGKTVTFSGYSLTGADAGNYILSAQPANVTANISHIPIERVSIPAGTFTMGQTVIATPVHSVTLSGFYMGKYQITQDQYQAVMGTNPSSFKSAVAGENGTPGRLPVERVSWYDTLVFCNKLSILEGLSPAYRISGSTDPAVWITANGGSVPRSSNATWDAVEIVAGSNGYRLPTEAQWEYACRAGTTTAYNTGDTISDNTGWYESNSGSKTHEVGKKPANAWGLYDMHGNVYEWCWDWYGNYSSEDQYNPMGASSGTGRMLRGGYCTSSASSLRSASRFWDTPYLPSSNKGFRLVRP